jgi:hypothetical protein
MEFRAYGYNLRKEDYATIEGMFRVITTKKPQVCDIRSYEPESNAGDILFLFGTRATKECKGLKCKTRLEFPDVSKLDAGFGDIEERKEAMQKLLELEKVLREDTVPVTEIQKHILSDESLPALSTSEVLALEETLRKQGISEWRGMSKSGLSVCLSWVPGRTDADINLTFPELYALKAAMETLQIEEFEIVRRTAS